MRQAQRDEEIGHHDSYLRNDSVGSFTWRNIHVSINDKASGKEKHLLQAISGNVQAGELVALIGPSGSGKTTLLNLLAQRPTAAANKVEGDISINRVAVSAPVLRQAARYVEQEDCLVGSLTTQETLDFAAKLGLPGSINRCDRQKRVDQLLSFFGLLIKERANGLYGAGSFLIANFLIGLPYLFLIAVIFSVISYWLCNFRPDGIAFMTWIMWVFPDLVAAESLVVFVSSIFPVCVVALALAAFTNGLWMSVGGFLVTPTVLNVFWRYWARYIDYQSYVFQGMMVNEFSQREYACAQLQDGSCQCMYAPSVTQDCTIPDQSVSDQYGYVPGWQNLWVGILLCIVLGYRLLTLITLIIKKT